MDVIFGTFAVIVFVDGFGLGIRVGAQKISVIADELSLGAASFQKDH